MIGTRHGLVVVTEKCTSLPDGAVMVRARCDCGSERMFRLYNLKKAPPKSHRGCLRDAQYELPLGRPKHAGLP